MRNLKLQLYNRRDAPPTKVVILPLNTLQLSLRLLPTEIRDFLEQEKIDLSGCRDLIKERGMIGTLIEIETTSRRLVIRLDAGEDTSRQALRTIKERDKA